VEVSRDFGQSFRNGCGTIDFQIAAQNSEAIQRRERSALRESPQKVFNGQTEKQDSEQPGVLLGQQQGLRLIDEGLRKTLSRVDWCLGQRPLPNYLDLKF
jgi:hypothetical protein